MRDSRGTGWVLCAFKAEWAMESLCKHPGSRQAVAAQCHRSPWAQRAASCSCEHTTALSSPLLCVIPSSHEASRKDDEHQAVTFSPVVLPNRPFSWPLGSFQGCSQQRQVRVRCVCVSLTWHAFISQWKIPREVAVFETQMSMLPGQEKWKCVIL